MAEDEHREDQPFVSRLGPIVIDWPRSLGFYGGVAAAIAYELIAPELALFVAAVPLLKLMKRQHATKVETALAAVIEGAAQPLGGDSKATVRPSWLDDAGTRDAERAHMQDDTKDPSDTAPEAHAEDPREPGALDKMWRFACEHPVLSIFGAAGIGLLGGVELAGGVLIGAGVAAALRGTRGGGPERPVRERARSMISRAPHDIKERARAVVDSVRGRGKNGVEPHQGNGKQPH